MTSSPSQLVLSERASTSSLGARSEISLTNSLFANSGSSTGRPIVVSGIKPSLGLAEVVGILTVLWLGPLLSSPLTGVSTTLLSSQLYNTLLTVALSYLIAAALLCVFTELFYYYGDQCGGLYTACKKLNCHSLGHVVLSVSLLAVIVHAGTSMIDLSLYLDRVSSFEIADWQEAWSSSRVDIVAILLLLPLVVCTLFFVNGSAKICIGLSAAVVAAVLCASGYSINHGIQFTDLDTTFTISNNGSYMTSRARSNSSYESGVVRDTDSEDVKLSQFLHQLALVTSPLLVPALLSALSEDCKMKRHHALIAGIVTYVVTMLLHILFSLSISHITSSDDVYMDQLLLTIGVPQPLTIIMTVITSVTLYIRAVIILACGCRVMLGVAMFKEEDGLTGRFCTILRVPIVINTCIILLCAALVTSNGADVRALAMLLIFCFAMLGSVVQVLHRYILEEVTETTPIVGNFGSLKVQSTVRYLLAVLISAACFLWVSTLMDGILDHIYEVDMTWTVIQIFCVLAVVLCISIIASFKMATVEKPFRTIWTPTLPCVSIVICTFVIVTNWTYGLIMLGCIIILTVLVWVYDKLLRSCCCSVSVDNR